MGVAAFWYGLYRVSQVEWLGQVYGGAAIGFGCGESAVEIGARISGYVYVLLLWLAMGWALCFVAMDIGTIACYCGGELGVLLGCVCC
jgi:hypothetical protein